MGIIKIESVKSPVFSSPDNDSITMFVKFSHLDEEVPFTAHRNDTEEHGRDAYSRALDEEWGPVEDYTGPSKKDIEADRVRVERDRRLAASDPLVARALEYDNPEQLERVRAYRQALRDLPAQAGFPYDVQWPEKPACIA